MSWTPRLAVAADLPALTELIAQSVRGLQAEHYSEAQRETALGDVFGVDTQLIDDRTYYVVEAEGRIVAAGGWSRRRTLFGGDARRAGDANSLDPARDPARIRAYFVHPDWARRGLGRVLILACEDAIRGAGFKSVTMSATLPGEAFYAAMGYRAGRRYAIPMAGGLTLPVVEMNKTL